MNSGLEIRVCTLVKRVSGGQSHSLGQVEPHAGSEQKLNAIINAIATLEFDGTFVKSDVAPLRKLIVEGLDAGVPRETDLLVVGPAEGLPAEESELAAERALVIKDFLRALGVPAIHLAADAPSAYQTPAAA